MNFQLLLNPIVQHCLQKVATVRYLERAEYSPHFHTVRPKTHITLTLANKPNNFYSFCSKSWKTAGSIADEVIGIFL